MMVRQTVNRYFCILLLSSLLRCHSFSVDAPSRLSSTSASNFDGTCTTSDTAAVPSRITPISTVNYKIGDVIDLHHVFCHTPKPSVESSSSAIMEKSSLNHLSGFFRSLAYDNHNFHLGAFPLEPSPEPNCYLAPSIDGGLTRRLIAISPIGIGQSLSVPFSFELENQGDKIKTATLAATQQSIPVIENIDIVQDLGDGRGRGVFAGRDISAGELVAEWPYQMLPVQDIPLGMKDYMYKAPIAGKHAIVYGHGMLYNHKDDYNLAWRPPTNAEALLTGKGLMGYYAVKQISKGEELLVSYGEGYWKSRGITPQ